MKYLDDPAFLPSLRQELEAVGLRLPVLPSPFAPVAQSEPA
jgi:hypothetical protein